MGEILLAGEEPHERSALECTVISDRPPQHRIARFKRVEHRTLRDLTFDVDCHLTINPRQCTQMCWEHDSYHDHPSPSVSITASRERSKYHSGKAAAEESAGGVASGLR